MRKHGLTGTAEFNAYRAMVRRCSPQQPGARHYAERGITVCQEWLDDPRAFVEHIGPRPSAKHSVDRIDNNRGYEPGNVRWATECTQKRNRSNNRWLEAFGRRMVITDWARELGLDQHLIRYRLEKRGLPVEQALSTERQAAGRPKVMLSHNGETLCLTAWAKRIGVTPAALVRRMKITDSPEEILRAKAA